MLSVLKLPYVSDDLARQLVKNLVFVTRESMEADVEEVAKLFSKASFVGRKTLGSSNESTTIKLRAVVQYFSAMLSIMVAANLSSHIKASMSPMLKLVYRTYSDEQVDSEVKDLSTQIVDTFSAHLDKDDFIRQFNEVQQDITRARSERKLREKLMVGTVEGQMIKAKRRIKKSLKNKEKHRQEVQRRKMMK
jgi:hypothetical protein